MVLAFVPSVGAHAASDSPISVSPISGTFFANPANVGEFTAGPATPATFTQQFAGLNFNPPEGTLKCSPPTGINTKSHPFTNVEPQPDGSCKSVPAQNNNNNKEAGVGDLESFQAVFTGTFVVNAPGQITFNFFADDGWILSIGPGANGGQANAVSGQMLNFPRAGPFSGYPIIASFNLVSPLSHNDVVVRAPLLSSSTTPTVVVATCL
jgi:hypothetical protein